MALAAYVTEDGFVGHLWEERFLGLRGFDAKMGRWKWGSHLGRLWTWASRTWDKDRV